MMIRRLTIALTLFIGTCTMQAQIERVDDHEITIPIHIISYYLIIKNYYKKY